MKSDREKQSECPRTPEPKTGFRFVGEAAEPVFGDDRHAGQDTTYLEVSPEELIEVAKHLGGQGINHQESIARAYRMICEAHLISGNIRRWNEKVRRHHSPEHIFDLVARAEKNEQGQPRRIPLLVEFFKLLDQGSNSTNASKRFNEWFKHSARLKDYKATVPLYPQREDFNAELYQQLATNGWINWHILGGKANPRMPARTEPVGRVPDAGKQDEHPTRPYWSTSDVWWPEPSKEEVESQKSEYLNQARDAFISGQHARRAMTKFDDWLILEQQMGEGTKISKRPRTKGSKFVSPSDNGSDRDEHGQFRKKSE